jgi:hypothetical protein
MKKNIALSAMVIGILSSLSVQAADDLSSMFSEGKTSGQIRMFYIDRQYEGGSGNDTHRNSTAIGGHLKYETGTYKGLSLGASFYTTSQIYTFDLDVVDPSLLGTNHDSYSILGEAYVNYDMKSFGTNSNLKLGYQRYDVPMMGSDDARMIPNTFEAYKFTNKDINNVNIQVAHVNTIAYGTFSNVYSGGILAATGGYPVNGNAGTGTYQNLGQATVGKDTSGVTNFLVSFKNKDFEAKLSNDYTWDLYNTIYADATAQVSIVSLSAQVIKQNSVGNEYMKYSTIGGDGNIDSLYWAAKVAAKYKGISGYVAYSQTGENDTGDNSYKNAIVSQFGGMPAYTQGMVTRHQFLAGTKATKVVVAYSFKDLGTNLSAAAYYASYDVDANSGYGVSRTSTEPGFDIKYYPASVKNLQLRFRGNFPRDFAEATPGKDTGWNEYRLIANYNF